MCASDRVEKVALQYFYVQSIVPKNKKSLVKVLHLTYTGIEDLSRIVGFKQLTSLTLELFEASNDTILTINKNCLSLESLLLGSAGWNVSGKNGK